LGIALEEWLQPRFGACSKEDCLQRVEQRPERLDSGVGANASRSNTEEDRKKFQAGA
jgi:hypothetical protein